MKKVFIIIISTFLFLSCKSFPDRKGEFVVASNGDVIYQQYYKKQILWEMFGYDWLHLKSGSDDKIYTIDSEIFLSSDRIQINKNNMLLYQYSKTHGDKEYLTLYDVNNKKKIKTFTYSWSYPDYYWDEITNNFYISSEYGIIEYNERGKKLRYIIEYPNRFLSAYEKYFLRDARNNELLLLKYDDDGKYKPIFSTGVAYKLFLMNTKTMHMQLIYEGDKESGIRNGCISDDMVIWIKRNTGPKDYCLEAYDRKTGVIRTIYKPEPEHRIDDLMLINKFAFFKDNNDNVQLNVITGEKKIIGQGNYFTDGQYIWIEKKEADGSSQIIKEDVN